MRPAAASDAASTRDAAASVASWDGRDRAPTDDMYEADGLFGAPSASREVNMKPVDHGYCVRLLVIVAALLAFIGGGAACAFGVYGTFLEPYAWLPSGSQQRAYTTSLASFIAGGTISLLALIGCLGACRRSKRGLWLFGLLVAVLMTAAAACVAVLWDAKAAVDAWRGADYRLQSTSLSASALRTLWTLRVEVGTLYAFCAPDAQELIQELGRGDAPTQPAVLACTEPTIAMFGEW